MCKVMPLSWVGVCGAGGIVWCVWTTASSGVGLGWFGSVWDRRLGVMFAWYCGIVVFGSSLGLGLGLGLSTFGVSVVGTGVRSMT